MKDIKKIDNGDKPLCGYTEDCGNHAVARITSQDTVLHLCDKHREGLEEEMREKIQEKFEGMSKEEIAEKMVKDGEGLL